jgi:hypothetical protein
MSQGFDAFAKKVAQPDAVGRRSILGRVALLFAGVGAGVVASETPSFAATGGSCPPGLKLCGTKCRVVTIDPDNCGACGTKCGPNEICRRGTCRVLQADPTCPGSETWCGACVNTQTSTSNCGSCGHKCAAGETCSGGVCQTAPECGTASDCGVDTECVTYTCAQGVCGATFAAAGTVLAVQTPGDCQQIVCNGAGGTGPNPDDTDVPDPIGPCFVGVCVAGSPSQTQLADGAPCPGGVCNANGDCVSN